MFFVNASVTSAISSITSFAAAGLAAVNRALPATPLAQENSRLALETPSFRAGLFDGRWAALLSKCALGLTLGTGGCGDDQETINPAPIGECLPEEEAEKLDGGIAGLKNDAGGAVWICPDDDRPYDPGPGCDEGGCPTDTP